MNKIVTSKRKLMIPCNDVSLKEGRVIGDKLVRQLKTNQGRWIGLAANQIGYNARVLAMHMTDMAKEIVVFINPRITSHYGEIQFLEYCVSFPSKSVHTQRYQQVTVQDDLNGETSFYAPKPVGDSISRKINTTECVCIQHEIDHLDGITMFQRRLVHEPISTNKIGRNAKCPCGSNKKYKQCCLGG